MLHELKIKRSFAEAILLGDKTFELRINDRGYQKGDLIKFSILDSERDFYGKDYVEIELQGKLFEITYVLNGWGLEAGYVAFAIKPLKAQTEADG